MACKMLPPAPSPAAGLVAKASWRSHAGPRAAPSRGTMALPAAMWAMSKAVLRTPQRGRAVRGAKPPAQAAAARTRAASMKREDAMKQASEQLTKKLGIMEEVREAAWPGFCLAVALLRIRGCRALELCFEALPKGSTQPRYASRRRFRYLGSW